MKAAPPSPQKEQEATTRLLRVGGRLLSFKNQQVFDNRGLPPGSDVYTVSVEDENRGFPVGATVFTVSKDRLRTDEPYAALCIQKVVVDGYYPLLAMLPAHIKGLEGFWRLVLRIYGTQNDVVLEFLKHCQILDYSKHSFEI
jgi:hypothetical protein